MEKVIRFGIGGLVLFALTNMAFAAERVVLCEELYQET